MPSRAIPVFFPPAGMGKLLPGRDLRAFFPFFPLLRVQTDREWRAV